MTVVNPVGQMVVYEVTMTVVTVAGTEVEAASVVDAVDDPPVGCPGETEWLDAIGVDERSELDGEAVLDGIAPELDEVPVGRPREVVEVTVGITGLELVDVFEVVGEVTGALDEGGGVGVEARPSRMALTFPAKLDPLTRLRSEEVASQIMTPPKVSG